MAAEAGAAESTRADPALTCHLAPFAFLSHRPRRLLVLEAVRLERLSRTTRRLTRSERDALVEDGTVRRRSSRRALTPLGGLDSVADRSFRPLLPLACLSFRSSSGRSVRLDPSFPSSPRSTCSLTCPSFPQSRGDPDAGSSGADASFLARDARLTARRPPFFTSDGPTASAGRARASWESFSATSRSCRTRSCLAYA